MNDISSLSDRELDRALAEAIGWVLCRSSASNAKKGEVFLLSPADADARWSDGSSRFVWPRVAPADGQVFDYGTLPRYSTSLDALAEVEGRLREAGWWQWIESPGGVEYRVTWSEDHGMDDHEQYAVAPTEARARAEAALMSLRVLHNGEGE